VIIGASAMHVNDIVWLDEIVDKIESEHHVYQDEVEEVFGNRPKYRKGKKGKYRGEICFMLMAAPTAGVICLSCSFIN
jgi:hypothetical protein